MDCWWTVWWTVVVAREAEWPERREEQASPRLETRSPAEALNSDRRLSHCQPPMRVAKRQSERPRNSDLPLPPPLHLSRDVTLVRDKVCLYYLQTHKIVAFAAACFNPPSSTLVLLLEPHCHYPHPSIITSHSFALLQVASAKSEIPYPELSPIGPPRLRGLTTAPNVTVKSIALASYPNCLSFQRLRTSSQRPASRHTSPPLTKL